MNALVMYFSRAGENYGVGQVAEGNTAVVARMVAEAAGADLYEIAPAAPYPEDYKRCTEVAKQEKRADARGLGCAGPHGAKRPCSRPRGRGGVARQAGPGGVIQSEQV